MLSEYGPDLKEDFKFTKIFLYDVDSYLKKFFWNGFQTWSIAKINSTKYFKIDHSPILIQLFETAAIIYVYIFFKKGVRHISVKIIICIVLSFEVPEKYSGKILMLKSFNRKLNSTKFDYFSWIAKIKFETFRGKSLITNVPSAKTAFLEFWIAKINSVKHFYP